MAAFSYVALNTEGRKVKGLLEADSERQVRGLLRLKDLKPVEVHATSRKTESKSQWLTFSRHWSVSELALVTRQLATLVQSNLPLAEALQAVAEQSNRPAIKSVLMSIRSRVNEGHSLAHALAEHPAVFNDLYIGMVRAGEHAGFLGVVLDRLADYTEKTQHSAQQIKTALIYPIILLVVSLSVIIALMIFVVPELIRIFENTESELPTLTVLLIATSNFVSNYGVIILVGAFVCLLLFRFWLRKPSNRLLWHRQLLHVPVLSGFINKVNTTRFSSTLGTLLQSGVPLLEALTIARTVLTNLEYKERAQLIVDAVREGKSLRYALETSGFFPPMLVHMVGSGEKSGELENMLQRGAESQERELDTAIAGMMSVMEPIMVLFLGGFVMTIVMAILLPIFGMNKLFT
jgi:general secretion pathway protein F